MLWSVGHSNHAIERFAELLKAAAVEVVADVRSRPYSRFVPAYNREILETALRTRGIGYDYMGEALGGRPRGQPAGYHARVQQRIFLEGIDRLRTLSAKRPVAMMCAERHPLDCHRCRLIGRFLLTQGEDVHHLLPEGGEVAHSTLEAQLLGRVQADLFGDEKDRLDRAYM